MTSPAYVGQLLRAVALPNSYGCPCGYVITHVGVGLMQPQPAHGDYTACPQCLSIYRLGEDLTPRLVPERFIPREYVMQRDKLLERMKREHG